MRRIGTFLQISSWSNCLMHREVKEPWLSFLREVDEALTEFVEGASFSGGSARIFSIRSSSECSAFAYCTSARKVDGGKATPRLPAFLMSTIRAS
jgi:hypothetical protein